MSQTYDSDNTMPGDDERENELEQLLLKGLSLTSPEPKAKRDDALSSALKGDVQGALGLFAEGSQDMATATLELSLGRHFACVDFCNQAAEKAAQSVSLLRFGHRSMYDHDLRALGVLVGAPEEIQDEMAQLTPFHPEAFYMDTPPEEADEIIDATQASYYVQCARKVLRWTKTIVLAP